MRSLPWQSHVDELCQIVKFHLASNDLRTLVEIVVAEGTNRDHVLGACFHSFLDSEGSILLSPIVIAGHDAASATAAIRIGFGPSHLP